MTKYHSVKVEADGRIFDSKMERDYYIFELLPKLQSGEIVKIQFQPRFLLQPAFWKKGKRYRAIEYVADFKVVYKDGHKEIIDVKGFQTAVFQLKRKLFEYKYKDLELKVVK